MTTIDSRMIKAVVQAKVHYRDVSKDTYTHVIRVVIHSLITRTLLSTRSKSSAFMAR